MLFFHLSISLFTVSWINAAHDERSKREISLFASAAVVTASVIGSIAYPLGAGVAVGLSILNRLKISELEDEMRLAVHLSTCIEMISFQ